MTNYQARSSADGLSAFVIDALRAANSDAYRNILDALPAAVYATDAEGRITYFNPAAAALAGRQPHIGEKWCVTWKLYTADGVPLPHDQCPMAVSLREKRAIRGVEAIAERPDGTRFPFLPYPTPLFSPEGELVGGINLLIDISERKAAEAALHAESAHLLAAAQREVEWQRSADHARQQLASIVESSADGIISKDLNGNVVSWNGGAERVFGYSAAEMIGQPITMLMPADRQNEEVSILERVRRGERVESFETVRRRKDGSLIDVSLTISPVRNSHGTIVGASKIARDVTARKRAETALARHMDEQAALFRLTDGLHRAVSVEEIYDFALDAIQQALRCDRASILLTDAQGIMRFVAWRGLSDGYRRAVDGHSPWRRDDPNPEVVCVADVAASDLAPELKATVVGEGIGACAFIPLVAGGRLIGKFMTYYGAPHEFSGGEIDLAVAVARQLAFGITKRRAEERLRTNEERLRLATEAGKVGVWEWDVANGRVAWTDSLYAIHGIDREAFPGTQDAIGELTHPDDRDRVAAAIRQSAASGEPCTFEFRVIKPSGDIAWLYTTAAVVREEGRAVRLLGSTIDITERKQADAQRDLLVAELSHRVKNTLATVISIAHQSFSRGPSIEDARRSFDGRIRALAQTHGRLAEGNWSGASLETMVDDELAPYRREDGGNVQISGPRITLSPKHAVVLGMALHELATNAAKYGALSNKSGVVEAAWTLAAPAELHIHWKESGGPAVVPPRRSGFGRLLLERALASDLQGSVELNFAPAGLTCQITVPLDGRGGALE
jgi:PAS domain S-box-containing protein